MAVSGEYRARAEQLAAEVAAATGSRRTWRKVTTLLAHFDVYRLTPAVRHRISEALTEAGIEVEPAIEVVERYGTVRLAMRQPDEPRGAGRAGRADVSGAVTATFWRPRSDPVVVSADVSQELHTGVLWLDVDVTQADEPDALYRALVPFCGDALTPDMVAALLEADTQPIVKELGGGVRNVTAFEVVATESQAEAGDLASSKAGTLSFQLVEFLQTERWLVSCWHKRHPTADGVHEQPEQPPAAHRGVLEAVAVGWRTNGWETAGDLGLAVLTELAATYTSAGRTLFAWHEAWELDFYRRKHATEIETLHDLRQLGARFRVQLEALNQPGMSRDPRLVWFSHVSEDSAAERADDLIDRALANLRSFSEVLRTSTDLVATMSFSEQSRRSEQFQEFATLVAAVLLVPTLVAGIYGANTRLPGEHDWSGFVVMLIAMVISAVATFGFIRVWRRRGGTDD